MPTKFDSDSDSKKGSNYDSASPDQLKNLEDSFAAPAANRSGSDIAAEKDKLEQAYNLPSTEGTGADRSAPTEDSNAPVETSSATPEEDAIPSKKGNEGKFDAKEAKKGENSKQLNEREKEAEDSLYTPDEKQHNGRKRWWTKKKTAAAGGIAGVASIGGLLGLTSVLGPLQFVHLAQNLHATHMSSTENANDGRLGKIYRWIKSGGDVGQTRMGYLSSKYHARIMGKLATIGVVPNYDGTLRTYKGFTLDTENKKSPYHGMTPEEAAQKFESKTGIKPTINGAKLQIDADKFWAQRKSLKVALNDLGESKVTTAVRSRVLAKFGLVSWHPLTIADKKFNNSVKNLYDTKWKNRIKNGIEPPAVVDGKSGKSDTVGSDGKNLPISDAEAQAATDAPKNGKSLLQQLAKSRTASVTGGLAAAAGLMCTLKAVDDNVSTIRFAQVIKPLIHLGLNMIAVGNQIMLNQDVSQDELDYLSSFFNQYDQNGKLLSTWSDALSIREANGQTGGIDMTASVKELISQDRISWLSWTHSSFMNGLCSTVGTLITGALSITLGIISGGTISAIIGGMTAILATPLIVNVAGALMAGDGLDVMSFAGAQWGMAADYGARYGADMQALQFAGTALTATQSLELEQQESAEQQAEFDQQSFFARAFNPYDYRSLTARVIDSGSSNPATNVASMFQGVLGAGSSAFSLPLNMFSSSAHAANTYQYPSAKLGMSLAEQNNPLIADPFDNADITAATLLEKNDTGGVPDYIERAQNCYGVKIQKTTEDGHQLWGAVSTGKNVAGEEVNPFDSSYDENFKCSDVSDNWLRVRTFIRDTGIMEGYACSELNDAQSCANDGLEENGSSAGTGEPDSASLNPGSTADYNECNKTATGNAKIVCSAYLFDNYDYQWGGKRGNASFLTGFLQDVKTCVGNNYGAGCKYPKFTPLVDCSGMVAAAVFDATGVDLGGAGTESYPSNSNFQEVAKEEAQPGDILWYPGHTEVIVSNDTAAKTYATFGAHTPSIPNEKQIGPASYTYAKVSKVFRVIKP